MIWYSQPTLIKTGRNGIGKYCSLWRISLFLSMAMESGICAFGHAAKSPKDAGMRFVEN